MRMVLAKHLEDSAAEAISRYAYLQTASVPSLRSFVSNASTRAERYTDEETIKNIHQSLDRRFTDLINMWAKDWAEALERSLADKGVNFDISVVTEKESIL